MRDFAIVFVHLIVTLARLARPGGLRSVLAESVLVRHQLLILNRGRKRAQPSCLGSDHRRLAPVRVWEVEARMLSTPPRPRSTMPGTNVAVRWARQVCCSAGFAGSASTPRDGTIPNHPIPRCLPAHPPRRPARILSRAASRPHARLINPPP